MRPGEGAEGFRVWMRRMQAMTVKELRQLFRDPVLLLFLAYAFTANVFLSGSGVSLKLSEARLYVLDHDRSRASRELISRFRPPAFSLAGKLQSQDQAQELLDTGHAMLVMDIPEDFQEEIRQGKQVSVQLLVDASHTVLANLAAGYAQRIVSEFTRQTVLGPQERLVFPAVRDRHRVWFNPNQRDAWFNPIIQLLNFITLVAVLLPAAAMVREKERGTVEQLLVTPLSSFQIVFPKVLAMTLVILAGTTVSVFGVMQPAFDVPLLGSPLLFMAAIGLYVFSVSGLGLLIATLCSNLGQAGLLTILGYAPMIFLSGAWTPPEAMPGFMRAFLALSPLHYLYDITLGIFLKGAGLAVLWEEVLAMLLLGGGVFALGLWRIRRQFA